MLACACCPTPFKTKSDRTMRDHKKKMRESGKKVPKSKPGRKAIKKAIKFVVVPWEDKVTEMATEHYGASIEDSQYLPADVATPEEDVHAGVLFAFHELTEAITKHVEDDHTLFGKQHIIVTDPTNHMRGVSIGSF